MSKEYFQAEGLTVKTIITFGLLFIIVEPSLGAIYRWDTGELITEKDAEPGADLSCMNLRYADLTGAQLAGASFFGSNLSHARLSGADLTNAQLSFARLREADFSEAVISDAQFKHTTWRGFTEEQLLSTASYQDGDLRGIRLSCNSLRGWDLSGKNLSDTDFSCLTFLCRTDLSFSDLRGAELPCCLLLCAASMEGVVFSDGTLNSLQLQEAEDLRLWDYNGLENIPYRVENIMSLDPDSTLKMVFEDDFWGSTIVFEPEIPVNLGGTLSLQVDKKVDPNSLVGVTFHLFDWEGVNPTGTFTVQTSPGHVWDLGELYTTGNVTLVAVPEPAMFSALLWVILALLAGIRRSR